MRLLPRRAPGLSFNFVRMLETPLRRHALMIYKVIKMEVDLRALWEQVDDEGIMLEHEETGKKFENPLISTISKMQKDQLSIIRSMGLNTPSTDPRTMARAVENVRNHQATAEKNKGSLLAQPH